MDRPEELEFARLLLGGIIIVVLLALIIVSFAIIYQRNLYAQQKKMHQLTLTYQKDLLTSAVQSQESERERIAQDLHDEVGASLSTAKLFINQIQYETSGEEIRDLAQQANQILGDIVQDVRQITQNMSPALLESFGLAGAVNILLNRLKANGVQINYQVIGEFSKLNKEKQLALFRIIQEVIGNIVKHAAATHILVQLHHQQNVIMLSIVDNGCGFDTQVTSAGSTGIGMATIKARTGFLNGQLNLASVIGQGTRLELTIPL